MLLVNINLLTFCYLMFLLKKILFGLDLRMAAESGRRASSSGSGQGPKQVTLEWLFMGPRHFTPVGEL